MHPIQHTHREREFRTKKRRKEGGMMKKGRWSKEEDNLIKNHIEKYGIGNSWQALSNTLGLKRSGSSCRSRWLNNLQPGLKHGNFTLDEEIICTMYSNMGSWTDQAIKNYWNKKLKKMFPAARTPAAYRCRTGRACSTSYDAVMLVRGLQLVAYSSKESSTAGSSPAKPVLAGPLLVPVVDGQGPIAAVRVSGPRLEKPLPPPPPPACDQTAERVMEDTVCVPMSPVPLCIIAPEFDDIYSFSP